jgi:probable HAF family extracellular repeat protein
MARAINDAGIIVGAANDASGVSHAFVHANGKMTDAGSLPGMRYCVLLAINGSGVAVGLASESSSRGVIYGAGKMVDLNSLVDGTPFTILSASGIDESGDIVAQGVDPQYSSRALLLRPH